MNERRELAEMLVVLRQMKYIRSNEENYKERHIDELRGNYRGCP